MSDVPKKLKAANDRLRLWRDGTVPADSEVLALLNEVRMALEASQTSKVFATLRSYCDLLFHEEIDRKVHYHRLFAASACLRKAFREHRYVSFDDLYDAVFSASTLAAELYALFDRFDLEEGKKGVFEFRKAILVGLFRNLHEHRITCKSDVTTNDSYDLQKAASLFGAPEIFVVEISFDKAPSEGQVSAQLELLNEVNGEVGIVTFVVPVTIH